VLAKPTSGGCGSSHPVSASIGTLAATAEALPDRDVLLFRLATEPAYALVVAANRDERYRATRTFALRNSERDRGFSAAVTTCWRTGWRSTSTVW